MRNSGNRSPQKGSVVIIIIIIIIIIIAIIIIIIIIIIQEIGFTESLLNWKTSTGPNSAQLPFLYVIYTDFGNGECRPRIVLFKPFKNKFQ